MLVIEGKSRQELKEEAQARWDDMSVKEHMEYYESQGIGRKRGDEAGGEGPGRRQEGYL